MQRNIQRTVLVAVATGLLVSAFVSTGCQTSAGPLPPPTPAQQATILKLHEQAVQSDPTLPQAIKNRMAQGGGPGAAGPLAGPPKSHGQ